MLVFLDPFFYLWLCSIETRAQQPTLIVNDNTKIVHIHIEDVRINAGEQIETITSQENKDER